MPARGAAIINALCSLHRSIREIDKEAWNRLALGNAFATHGWLLTIEASCRASVEPLYFALYRDGALIAASVCYVAGEADEIETLDDMIFGRVKRWAQKLGLNYLPAMMCGPLLGYGWHIGVDLALSADDAERARTLLLDAMEAEAGSRGLGIGFANILEGEADLQSSLAARDYLRCGNVPVAVLDIEWSSFDDYLAHLPRKTRKEFRRQINRHSESGAVTTGAEVSQSDERRLLALLDGNALRHSSLPFAFGPGFFEELQRALGPQARIYVTRRDGAINAVVLVLHEGRNAYVVAAGVDQAATRDDYTYFQITYNSPIGDCIAGGCSHVFFGRGMYEIKVRRGCRLIPNWTYAQASGKRRTWLACWFRIASAWNRHQVPAPRQARD
jgi:predicted N-acyltransferase